MPTQDWWKDCESGQCLGWLERMNEPRIYILWRIYVWFWPASVGLCCQCVCPSLNGYSDNTILPPMVQWVHRCVTLKRCYSQHFSQYTRLLYYSKNTNIAMALFLHKEYCQLAFYIWVALKFGHNPHHMTIVMLVGKPNHLDFRAFCNTYILYREFLQSTDLFHTFSILFNIW